MRLVDARTVAGSLRAGRGAYAVLVGAGVSDSAGVTTGEDLLRGLAATVDEDPGAHGVAWYRERHGSRPNYFSLVTPDERATRLPPEPYAGREPTPAHRAIVGLTKAGLLHTILTPNLDPLLETAFRDAGVPVSVARTLAEMAAEPPPDRVRLVKLHGDYRDIGIRYTSAGRDRYHPTIDRLLDGVLSTSPLLVAGWSGAWDVALGAALARPANRRETRWLLRGEPTAEATRLIEARDAAVCPVLHSDAGLTEVAAYALAT